ncbi:hypothetical protein [Oricola sp.]|uniref:hypothetical protein n=1 Tax=Oricola sp. TaxID=1979950 RepID=UPI003BACE082
MTARSRIRDAMTTVIATILATSVFTASVAVSAIALEPPKDSQAWIDCQATGSIAKPAAKSYLDMMIGKTGVTPKDEDSSKSYPSAPVMPSFGI